jgi:hypothetical protein
MGDMMLKADHEEAEPGSAFGHHLVAGLLNRDYPARASVGKRSGMNPAGSLSDARSTSNRRRTHARADLCRP